MNHLDIAGDFSFMRAYGTPAQVCDRVQAIGGSVVGVCDYLSTWGHVPFAREAAERGLGVVYGAKFPVVLDASERSVRHDLVGLIATTREALSELYKLSAKASDQMYFRPRLTWKQIIEARERGLASVAYSVDGMNIDYMVQAKSYVALGRNKSMLIDAALRGELPENPVIFAAAPSFPRLEDRDTLDTLLGISHMLRSGEALSSLAHAHIYRRGEAIVDCSKALGCDRSVVEDAIERSGSLAVRFAIRDFGRASLIDAPEDWSIRDVCMDGLKSRGLDSDAYRERLDRELLVIQSKGFASYFYFVARIVSWAADRMLVGPGRGSAGGCLVAYLLGITDVDPLVHGTLFERFIDPSRSDMPDIDVDFQDSRRDLVFDKLAEWYGEDHVARIGTVSVFGGKSAINDVGRFERSVPFDKIKLLGLRAEGINIGLGALFEIDDVCQEVLEQHPGMRAAADIEGHARHHGVHAAGVCVAREPITDFAAIDRRRTASLTLDDAAGINLLKFDALGLTTLSVIGDACDQIGIDPYSLRSKPLDDDAVYKIFRQDDVTGVFQFEGATVRGLMRAIHTDRFSDLCALVAIARPGPLQGGAAEGWVKRRSGQQAWSFEHELLEPITRDTYGLIIYEEQMMKILTDIAGFSVLEVNKVRKSVKKKDPEVLHGFHSRFMEGCTPKIGQEMAQCLWESIEEFGAYAFNLAHSVAYAMVSYQSAWLRAYHPAEFALALLRYTPDAAKCKLIIRQLAGRGVPFCAFDPDLSEVTWSIKDGTLYGGFTGLIGVAAKTAAKFVALREDYGQGWVDARTEKDKPLLTVAQRAKLDPMNTPWADIDFIGRKFSAYFSNPRANNIGADRVHRLDEIPATKGSYVTIARVSKTMLKDKNEPDRVARRGGQKVTGKTKFLNLILDDDGIEMGATINNHKFEKLGKPLLEGGIGKYVVVRGDILGGDGPKWLMVEKLRVLDVASVEDEDEE